MTAPTVGVVIFDVSQVQPSFVEHSICIQDQDATSGWSFLMILALLRIYTSLTFIDHIWVMQNKRTCSALMQNRKASAEHKVSNYLKLHPHE